METLYYDTSVLPVITLLGEDISPQPHHNIRRVSEDYIFYFVQSGTLTFCEGDREYTLCKGDTFLFEPGVLHYGVKDTKYTLYYLHFRHLHTAFCEDTLPNALPIPKQMHFGGESDFVSLSRLFQQIIDQRDQRLDFSSVLTACAVDRFFIEAVRRNRFLLSGKSKSRGELSFATVNRVIAYLNENYSCVMDSKTLERELSYNFDYLNQLFRRHLGTTIFRMLESIRIEHAQSLLLTGEMPVSQIAREVGYRDEAYFSKVFKKNTGLSPTAYRWYSKTAL